MNETKWIVAHFSPTGTTSKVARAIAEGSGCHISEMDLSAADCDAELTDHSVLLAAIPVYGGRVPAVAIERLSKLQGNGQSAVAVAVYGNREFDDALLELKDAMEANGFRVVAAGAFIAEHSIVRSIAAGRPDAEDLKIARQFGADIMRKLNSDEILTSVTVPGNNPYVAVKPSAFHPKASETCIQCGACAEKCPVDAIPLEDPSQTMDSVCINCMRCIQVCPVKSRALPAPFVAGATKMLEEKAAGYKLPQLFGV